MAVFRMLVSYGPVVLAALCFSGCGQGGPGSGQWGGSAWDDPGNVAILEPFQGKWQFDQERTLAQWEAGGMSEEEIARVREFYLAMGKEEAQPDSQPGLRALGIDPKEFRKWMSQMHENLTFDGHVAIGDGLVSCEYRLFAVHKHDGRICAKAWHHEDRFDPGDMSKCYVKLAIEGEEFHLQVRMQDGWPETGDPDLKSKLPILAGSDYVCDADDPAGKDWGEWTTYVFVRPSDTE